MSEHTVQQLCEYALTVEKDHSRRPDPVDRGGRRCPNFRSSVARCWREKRARIFQQGENTPSYSHQSIN